MMDTPQFAVPPPYMRTDRDHYRCCLAVLLGFEDETVIFDFGIHIDHPLPKAHENSIKLWLAEMGLAIVSVQINNLEELMQFHKDCSGIRHIVTNKVVDADDTRHLHSVVAQAGVIIHDPWKDGPGIMLPSHEHPWQIDFVVNHWRPMQ